MVLVARLYARRIININVNIVLAGVLAGGLTLIPVHMTRRVGIDNPWAIKAIALAADICFDVVIYYLLHWVANHTWNPYRKARAGEPKLSFLRDATLVQFERALLAPAYYGVMLGVLSVAMHVYGAGREWATIVAVLAGLAITRAMHTAWMIRRTRRGAVPEVLAPAACPTPETPPRSSDAA